MARPKKKGFGYFPLTTDYLRDDKVIALRVEISPIAPLTNLAIWGRMFEAEGPVDINKAFSAGICSEVGITPDELTRTIELGIEVGLLLKTENGQLFSEGVRKQLLEIGSDRNRMRTNREQTADSSEFVLNKPKQKKKEIEQTANSVSLSLLSLVKEVGGVGEETIPQSENQKLQYRPRVFLTTDQHQRLLKDFGEKELNYWFDRLEEYAAKNPKKWAKDFQDHNLTIRSWRNRKLEDGFIFDSNLARYTKPKNFNQGKPDPIRPQIPVVNPNARPRISEERNPQKLKTLIDKAFPQGRVRSESPSEIQLKKTQGGK